MTQVPRILSLAILTAMAGLLPPPAKAETLGEITAFLNGARQTWFTVTHERQGPPVATATFTQHAHKADLLLQGHREPDIASPSSLSIEVSYPGQYSGAGDPMDVRVLYLPNGLGGPYWTSKGSGRMPEIRIIDFRVWGNIGRVELLFDAKLCFRARLTSQTNPDRCQTVNGLVATKLTIE